MGINSFAELRDKFKDVCRTLVQVHLIKISDTNSTIFIILILNTKKVIVLRGNRSFFFLLLTVSAKLGPKNDGFT